MKELLAMSTVLAVCSAVVAQETLPPLRSGKAPQTFEEMWAEFDARKEPLDVQVLKEWEEDGVALKVLRYRIGVFKGKRAMMAAVYGHPKGGKDLPGLVQIHGGGQYAHWNACFTNAKRGYATLSISWAGRIDAPGHRVGPDEVKLFWEGKTEDPNCRLTTDWGALDAYHAPCRYESPEHQFVGLPVDTWTLDPVASPRNSAWFLCALGTRRALTFLERQLEVDGKRLGVYGHSMGGKITVLAAAADRRVKAAAPSCGGISDRKNSNPLFRSTLGDDVNLKHVTCPIMFLSPANDFHGRIEDLQSAVTEIESADWRATCGAHHNHQDTAAHEVATQLWMDHHLKGAFSVPRTPETELEMRGDDGAPSFAVTPDASRPILSVDVYYTQQGDGVSTDRFWHHAAPVNRGDTWVASVPVLSTAKPLWVYADVLYSLDTPVTGAGYYYATYTTESFSVSSLMGMVSAAQLEEAGVRASMESSPTIEDFTGDWKKEWFVYSNDPAAWRRHTRKVGDDRYRAPAFAKLAVDVRAASSNQLVVGFGSAGAVVDLDGGGEWQSIVLFPTDFRDAEGRIRVDWEGVSELRLSDTEHLRPKEGKPIRLGGDWQGEAPEFRNLRWVEGTRDELNARREIKLIDAPVTDGRIYLDYEFAEAHTDGYKSVTNTWLDGGALGVDGESYAHGLTTHAPAETVFFLGGRFGHFHVIAQAWKNATVRFEVVVDGKKVLDSGPLTHWQTAPVDLSVKNVQELKLIVSDGGNGRGGDHASWVDAYLTTATRDPATHTSTTTSRDKGE